MVRARASALSWNVHASHFKLVSASEYADTRTGKVETAIMVFLFICLRDMTAICSGQQNALLRPYPIPGYGLPVDSVA